MSIGSFAIVTVLGRTGDGDHDLTRYRGLAHASPSLALASPCCCWPRPACRSPPACGPSCRSSWPRCRRQLGAAGGDRHGDRGHRRLLLSAGGGADVRVDPVRSARQRHRRFSAGPVCVRCFALPSAGPDVTAATVTTLNTELLLADDAPAPTGEETPTVIPIPALTSVAIGICVAFTVVFGVIPSAAVGLRQPRHAPLPGPLARRVRHRPRRQGRVHHAHRGHERR